MARDDGAMDPITPCLDPLVKTTRYEVFLEEKWQMAPRSACCARPAAYERRGSGGARRASSLCH
jgi:hypothetical protein